MNRPAVIPFPPEPGCHFPLPMGRVRLLELAGEAARAGAIVCLVDPFRDHNARTRHDVGGAPIFHLRHDDPDLPVVEAAADLILRIAAPAA